MTIEFKTQVHGIYKSSDGFLINKDAAGLAAYKKRKSKDVDLINLKKDMITMKEDMKTIKELLERLIK